MTNNDPTDLLGQERDKAEELAKKRFAETTEDEDWKWLMSSRRGRRIVWRLLDQAGVNRISFDPNALAMAFKEGNRNYGNKVLASILASSPEQYPTLLKENLNGRHDGSANNPN